ncbi:hypothetical protein D7X74_21220 [Corallococcus sp. CA047B]|uniref:hypothetical protein n=1 Tax=Corallococcus sp. CA047B TaxID=2316729 RepID=UPI000EA39EBA|nr:hypothetical protein [Corallococcus sp. CA047B]RKH13771.1 hypothetical protein D7X74_21220 [Corallococcus sp. CA047B]
MTKCELETLPPAELMRRAIKGGLSAMHHVNRELQRRGPDACKEALKGVPVDEAAMAQPHAEPT